MKLIIELLPDGNVNVSGPLGNKLLCYGLLEEAKNIIKDYKPSQIVKPTNGDLKIIEKEKT